MLRITRIFCDFTIDCAIQVKAQKASENKVQTPLRLC